MARYWIFTFACLVFSCSGDDDPPVLNPRVNGEAGDGSGGSTSGRGGTGTGGSGNTGTGGSGNIGGLGRPDPDEVYILGSLELARPDLGALFHWSEPEDYAIGFAADLEFYKAKIGEAGLLYQLRSKPLEIRRFVPELTTSAPVESIDYPADPTANDPIFQELDCSNGSSVLYFVVGPNDRIVYYCANGLGWFIDGMPVYNGPGDMWALGNDDLAIFTEPGVGHFVVDLGSGEKTQIMNIGTIRAVRALSEGFLVAGIGDNDYELWEVSPDGETSSRGRYMQKEPGIFEYLWALDADGNLYQAESVGDNEATLMLRRLDGDNEIVHDDLMPENAFLNTLGIVTGP